MINEIERPSFPLAVNGRDYSWPSRTTVVICFDGCDPAYLHAARAVNAIPAIDRMVRDGFATVAHAVMPTFTNPNNVSIVCGAPPSVHGVSGNFFLDRATGEEIMMVDATPMRAPTILAGFAKAGAKVVAITAKDKLRKALGYELNGIVFSAEKAYSCTLAENGIEDVTGLVGRETPSLYSADLSLFVLDAGIRLLERQPVDLMYLSLSDYVQHKYAPDELEAIAFMREVDRRIQRLARRGRWNRRRSRDERHGGGRRCPPRAVSGRRAGCQIWAGCNPRDLSDYRSLYPASWGDGRLRACPSVCAAS
jgi:phosphonoacetate hydrolase